MAKQYQCVYFIAVLMAVLLASEVWVFTDPIDVAALEELYKTLNQPPPLTGWRLDGGDPCDESWNGVSCSGSSVIFLKLHGLNLSGSITTGLYNLYNLKQLDISSNSIGGEIPYVLPPNATHINMSCNFFTQNIQLSLPGMKSLRHLNLSHNLLSGPICNAFTGLQNLREMDLSYNNFTGDLPTSFGSLTNLTGLYLQNNQFPGSVAYLAELPLTHLDISSNSIGGEIPYVLPSNATHMNLSHNLLTGSIGNVFSDLQNLRQLDLSYNNFTGDVPSSFRSLTNLTGLYLKNNKFTGSVASLAELPPTDMNIRENYFSGIIPNHVQSIPNLWIGGNSCQVSGNNCPPRDVPLETKASESEQNIHAPPANKSSVIQKPGQKKKRLATAIFGTMIGCVVAAAATTACMAACRDPNNGQPPEQPAGPIYSPPKPPEKLALNGRFTTAQNYEMTAEGKHYHAHTAQAVVKKAMRKKVPPPAVNIDTFIDDVEQS